MSLCKKKRQEIEIVMTGKAIPCEDCAVHLGISRHVKEKANIEEKINLGRKTAYSLMGWVSVV